MKKILFLILLVFVTIVEGKTPAFEIGCGTGTGRMFLFEDIDKTIDISYSTPFAFFVNLKYIPESSPINIKLEWQYTNVGITGTNWTSNYPLDGEISSYTTFLIIEYLKNDKKLNFGGHLGFGYTHEFLIENMKLRTKEADERQYLNISIAGIASLKISDNCFLKFIPSLLWSDPVNTLRSSSKWYIGGEDLSILTQVGFSYLLNN